MTCRSRQDFLRQEVERLLLAHVALDLDLRATQGELRRCREALRRERLARWCVRPLDEQKPA